MPPQNAYQGFRATQRTSASPDWSNPWGEGTTLNLNRGSGSGQLSDFVGAYFLPEWRRNDRLRNPIEQAFLSQATTPGSLFGAASTAAGGYARELFRPGGEVATMISRARGGAIQAGFDPAAAASGERGILQEATGRVGDTFAQQAAGLEQTRFGALSGAFTETQGASRDLLESMFTGLGSANQLGLAQRAQRDSRRRFLGLF